MERPSFWNVPRGSKPVVTHIIPINTNVSPTKSVSFHPSIFQDEHVSNAISKSFRHSLGLWAHLKALFSKPFGSFDQRRSLDRLANSRSARAVKNLHLKALSVFFIELPQASVASINPSNQSLSTLKRSFEARSWDHRLPRCRVTWPESRASFPVLSFAERINKLVKIKLNPVE